MTLSHSERHLRVPSGKPFHLNDVDPSATPGLRKKDRATIGATLEELHEQLSELQERLWAEHSRSMLLVLQALDSGGKDGSIRRVFKGVNPQGVRVTGFRQPTPIEASHDFLWRINIALPAKGEIGIFNRSHYEDVVAAFVSKEIDDKERQRRFQEIRHFENYLDRNHIDVVKVFLHISKDEQRKRFQERIDDPKLREYMKKFIAEQELKWCDEEIPALGGITPRQAAQDPTRRESLDRLLLSYERDSDEEDEELIMQYPPRLRKLLGIG